MKYINIAILLLLVISACGQNENEEIQTDQMSTSVEKFKQIVDFPLKINNIKWELEYKNNEDSRTIPGPNDYAICAEIECDKSDYAIFKAAFVKDNANALNFDVYLEPKFIKPWFSNDIKQVFYKKADYMRINAVTYQLNPNIMGRTTFRTGFFCFIRANKLLLVIYK